MADIVIVASAFGMDRVRQEGHSAFIATVAASGAAGFEVRRELFASDDDTAPGALAALGAQIAGHGLWSVYSTPTRCIPKRVRSTSTPCATHSRKPTHSARAS